MRFLLSVIDDATRNHSAGSANSDEIAAIDQFNAHLEANGHWIMAAGIAGPNTAVTVDNRADAGVISESPYVQNHEYLSGFWLISAKDQAEAIELAMAGSKACNRKVEVRAFLGQ